MISANDIADIGTAQVTVFTPTPGGGTSTAIAFPIGPRKPTFAAAGLVNAANFGTSQAAPGGIATIFGTNLSAGFSGTLVATTLPLPTGLQGTSVEVNGISAPLFAVVKGTSSEQINFQIPWEIAGSGQATVIVQVSSGPGIFTTNSQGSGQAAALIANTFIFAAPAGSIPGSSARPANRGEFVSIFCTGLGDVFNRPASGAAAGGSSRTVVTPTVTVGGVNAPVSFSGLAPGYAGLYQIDVQVPAAAPTGNAVLVLVSVDGVRANAVNIAIQ